MGRSCGRRGPTGRSVECIYSRGLRIAATSPAARFPWLLSVCRFAMWRIIELHSRMHGACQCVRNAQTRAPTPRRRRNDRREPTALHPAGERTRRQTSSSPGRASRRPNFEPLQPSVVHRFEADRERAASRRSGQALNEQPAFGVPGAIPVGGQAGSFGSGQSFVNFLGLGDQRTLMLINGRRFVSSNTAQHVRPVQRRRSGRSQRHQHRTGRSGRDDRDRRRADLRLGRDRRHGQHHPEARLSRASSSTASTASRDRGDAANYRIRGIAGMNFADGRGNITISRRI